jgi:hypothetical protein
VGRRLNASSSIIINEKERGRRRGERDDNDDDVGDYDDERKRNAGEWRGRTTYVL